MTHTHLHFKYVGLNYYVFIFLLHGPQICCCVLLYNFQAVEIYASVATSLADRKKGSQLPEFLGNIKGTIDEDNWDQVSITIYLLMTFLNDSVVKEIACSC